MDAHVLDLHIRLVVVVDLLFTMIFVNAHVVALDLSTTTNLSTAAKFSLFYKKYLQSIIIFLPYHPSTYINLFFLLKVLKFSLYNKNTFLFPSLLKYRFLCHSENNFSLKKLENVSGF